MSDATTWRVKRTSVSMRSRTFWAVAPSISVDVSSSVSTNRSCRIQQLYTFLNAAIFWDIEPFIPYIGRRFGATYRLHLQGRTSAEQETSLQQVAKSNHLGLATCCTLVSCSSVTVTSSSLSLRMLTASNLLILFQADQMNESLWPH
jgi:hypothetical protein